MFLIFWMWSFLFDSNFFITMMAACTYYFNSNKHYDGEADIGRGFHHLFRYHIGSVAFGSLIKPIVMFIKFVIVQPATHAMRLRPNNAVKKFANVLGECCLKFFEKFTDYINNQAYSYVAITGQGFCNSAWDCFLINMKHAAKFRHASFLARVFISTI